MAPLSSILQNMKKTLLFLEFVHKGLTNFGCSKSKLFTLNYHKEGYFMLVKKISHQVFGPPGSAFFRERGLFCSVLAQMAFDNWTFQCTYFFGSKIPSKMPPPPNGILGIAKCQNIKIQCFPSNWNWFWISNYSNTLESSTTTLWNKAFCMKNMPC